MREEMKENTITLGFKELPAGMFTTYHKARLNGFDITGKLSCVEINLGERFDQENEPTRAVLTFKDGFMVVCQKIYVVELGKGEV